MFTCVVLKAESRIFFQVRKVYFAIMPEALQHARIIFFRFFCRRDEIFLRRKSFSEKLFKFLDIFATIRVINRFVLLKRLEFFVKFRK